MNRYNPMGLKLNHRGQLIDRYGREFTFDEAEFKRRRLQTGQRLQWPKVLNPAIKSVTRKEKQHGK